MSDKEINNITTKQIWFGIFLVVLFVGGYIIANKIFFSEKNGLEEKIGKIEKILSPYDSKDSLNKLKIIEGFENSSKNNEPDNVAQKTIITNGSIKDGFLYIKASVDSHSLIEGEDDIYVKIGGKVEEKYQEIGGHLVASRGLQTPKSDTVTELLYPLSDIKYKDSYLKNETETISGDFLKIINGGNSQIVIAFTSTSKKGQIEELSLYYECVSGSDCLITE